MLVYLLLFLGSSLNAQNTLPKVLILTTGGTIASRTNAPLIDGPALVQAVPELANYAAISVEPIARIGSSKMTPDIWLQMLKRIRALIASQPDLQGIVITHGTDTMEETAYFLNLTHQSTIPIVIVGSMRSSNEISADGSANLLNAVRVAVAPGSKGKGVLVVLNENISAARDLLKMNNRRVDAFRSTELGYLGFVDPDQVVFYRSPAKPHTLQSTFDLSAMDHLPSVDIVQDFAGLDKTIPAYFLQRPNAGLVVESFAGGRMSQAMTDALSQLAIDAKPVVIASGVKEGRIFGTNPTGTPLIIANDLPANKARILLMLALTKTKVPAEIQAIFNHY